ncbi:hypothetical protein ON010_g7467 [Phytophthora cinnamomi]|nr:hypothetical protein ON010_g7467 [Phytophthora cinnamomi]
MLKLVRLCIKDEDRPGIYEPNATKADNYCSTGESRSTQLPEPLSTKLAAAVVLVSLANSDQARTEIARTGRISILVGLLLAGTNAQKGYATSALAYRVSNDTIGGEIARCKGVSSSYGLERSNNNTT